MRVRVRVRVRARVRARTSRHEEARDMRGAARPPEGSVRLYAQLESSLRLSA